MKRIRFLLLVLLAALWMTPQAAAQGGQQPVPAELVRALLPGYGPHGEQTPEILVGRLPESFTRAVTLPGELRPVGSAVYHTHSLNVVAVPQLAGAVEQLAQQLLQAGWTQAPPFERGGFEASTFAQNVHLCRGEEAALTISPVQGTGPEGYLRLYHSTEARYSACRRPDRLRGPWPGTALPSLQPPPGGSTRGGGTSGSPDHVESSAWLTTDLTPAELIAHYAAQLREHGWTAEDENVSSGVAVQTWRFTDAEGERWHAVLIATVVPETRQREVLLRASNLSARR